MEGVINADRVQDADDMHKHTDGLLLDYVNLANGVEGSFMPITILSHGFLISGKLISGRTYFEKTRKAIGDVVAEVSGGDNPMDKYYDGMGISISISTNPEPARHSSNYIHIDEAKCFSGGVSMPGNAGVLWRGKLSDISGFWVGMIGNQHAK